MTENRRRLRLRPEDKITYEYTADGRTLLNGVEYPEAAKQARAFIVVADNLISSKIPGEEVTILGGKGVMNAAATANRLGTPTGVPGYVSMEIRFRIAGMPGTITYSFDEEGNHFINGKKLPPNNKQ